MTYTVVLTERTGYGPIILVRGASKLEAQSAAVEVLVASGKSHSMASSLVEKGLYGIVTLEGELVDVSLLESAALTEALREAEAGLNHVEDDVDTYGVIEMAAYVAGKDVGRAELARELLALLGLCQRTTLREQLAAQEQEDAMGAADAAE